MPVPDPDPDTALIDRAVAGDGEALSELLRRHGPTVGRRLSIGAAWAGVIEVDDVLQVTYLEAFLRIDRLQARDGAGFIAWLTRIAEHNLADGIKALRRARRPDPRRRVRRRPTEDSWTTLLDRLDGGGPTASRRAAGAEARDALERALAGLPESYRAVIRLYEIDGRTAPEVAAALGRSPGSVYMLRSRALDHLAERLGPASRYFSGSP